MSDDEDRDESSADAEEEAFLRAVAHVPRLAPRRTDEAMIGVRISHFVVRGVLGRGGMGTVYEAQDTALGRLVALKLLHPDEGDVEGRRRFLREARTASKVVHPNVGTIYEVGESDPWIYIAMERVQGPTLRAWLAGKPPFAERLRAARDIARAVGVAHDAGIVHRDLKPDNVMVAADGVIKVLDFGLAKDSSPAEGLDETATAPGRVLGTPRYMSPEQATGRPADARSDVFSLGILLYEMLTGDVPFRGASVVETLANIVRDTPRPAFEVEPQVSAELAAVIDRCLAKAPDARFPTAGALASALDASLSQSLSGASAARRAVPRARRPWLAGAAIAAVAIAVAAGAVAAGALALRARVQRAVPAPVAHAVDAGPLVITDFPPPVTTSPEAASLYARALQSVRDGSGAVAIDELEHATALDPSFAAAQLRLLYFAGFSPSGALEDMSKRYQAATETRASLSERDRALLDVLRPSEPPGVRPDIPRMTEVVARYPNDAEVAFLAALASVRAGRIDKTFEWTERALALDARFASAAWMQAVCWFIVGDLPAALEAANRCLDISPTAGSCLRNRMIIRGYLGDCAAMEQDARQGTVLEPGSARALLFLARAIAATGGTEEAVREALSRRWEATLPRFRRSTELLDRATLAVAFGDFGQAGVHLDALRDVPRSDSVDEPAPTRAWQLMMLYRETGDAARALATAKQELAERAGYVERLPEVDALAIATAARGGALTLAEAERLKAGAEFNVFQWPSSLLWAIREAYAVETPDEARKAVASLPDASARELAGLSRDLDRHYDALEGAVGRTLFLAGRTAEALPLLNGYARSCWVLASPFEWMRTQYFDGLAREANGDNAGACAAYARVLDRWGSAKPRSVTAEKSRARMAALRCGG